MIGFGLLLFLFAGIADANGRDPSFSFPITSGNGRSVDDDTLPVFRLEFKYQIESKIWHENPSNYIAIMLQATDELIEDYGVEGYAEWGLTPAPALNPCAGVTYSGAGVSVQCRPNKVDESLPLYLVNILEASFDH